MSRLLGALAVLGLTAALFALPRPAQPGADPAPGLDPAHVMVCPVQEGVGRTTSLAVVSDVAGLGAVTLFAGGTVAGSVGYETGPSGSALVPVEQIAAVGAATALVELPSSGSAASTSITGGGTVAHESCSSAPAQEAVIAGGSTLSGETLEILLMNPYAGEARVELAIRSESGLETLPELAGLTIPARSSAVADLDESLPGRETVTVTVGTSRGGVLVAGRQGAAGDEAVWNGVAPAQDWYLPIPAGLQGQIVIATGLAVDAAYQLDVYGPEGLVEAAQEGAVPAQGSVSIDLAGLGQPAGAPAAIRVISAQPVAVFVRSTTAGSVSVTSATPVTANRWLFPGAGATPSGVGSLVMLNTGLEDATVIVTALREQSRAFEMVVPPGQVVTLDGVEGSGAGYSIRSSEPVAAVWWTIEGPARALSTGIPFVDG